MLAQHSVVADAEVDEDEDEDENEAAAAAAGGGDGGDDAVYSVCRCRQCQAASVVR